MHRVAIPLVCVLLAAGSSGAQTPAASEALTLDEAVALALANNRPVAAASALAERADREAEALRTRRLPVFDVSALGGTLLAPLAFDFPVGSLGTYPATGPIPFADVDIESPARPVGLVVFTATQPLTQLRQVGLGVQARAIDADLAREEARRQRAQLVTDVKRVYFGLLQTDAGLRTVNEGLELLTALRRQVGEYVERQVALPGDQLEVESRLADTELQKLTVEHQRQSLVEQLNVLLGRDLETPVSVTMPAVPAVDPDVAAAQQRAIAQRPEVRDADLKARQAGINVKLKQAAFVPDVSVTASYVGIYNADVLPAHTTAVGLWLSWEPFDWGRRRLEKEAGERLQTAATLAQEEARARVRADVNARYRRVAEARAQAHAAEVADRLATERLRVARERFAQQASLLTDVLEAQLRVAESRQKRLQADAAFWTARTELDQATGDAVP